MNKIRDTTLVPQGGGFIYIDPDSGMLFKHCTVEHLIVLAKKHREANNYSALSIQDIIDNVCSNTPGPVCWDEPPPSAGEKARSLAKAVADSARSGFKTRSLEEVKAIMEICESCQYWGNPKGPLDVACQKCGCRRIKFSLVGLHCPIGKWS